MVRVRKRSQSLEQQTPRGASSVLGFSSGGQQDMKICQAECQKDANVQLQPSLTGSPATCGFSQLRAGSCRPEVLQQQRWQEARHGRWAAPRSPHLRGAARARFCLDGGRGRAVPLAVAQLAVPCTRWRLGNAVTAPRAAAGLKSAELRQNTASPTTAGTPTPSSRQLTPGALNNPSRLRALQQHQILLSSGNEPRL